MSLRPSKQWDATTIVVSTAEIDILQPQLPGQPLQIPSAAAGYSLGLSAHGKRAKGIVFVGGYQHVPNVDAVKYFVNEVMPLLRQRLPGARFHAVGSKPPEAITALAAPDVVIEGFVEDLKPLLDSMCLSVAPLRYGAGVKGKVGTALANRFAYRRDTNSSRGNVHCRRRSGPNRRNTTGNRRCRRQALWRPYVVGHTSANKVLSLLTEFGVRLHSCRTFGENYPQSQASPFRRHSFH